MNTGFHYELADTHGADLRRDAELARQARAARQPRDPAGRPRRRRAWLIGTAATASLLATGAGYASALGPSSGGQPWTPNDCIRLNGGDYNACNVGNSGRGDASYLPVFATGRGGQQLHDCRPTRLEHDC
jgi:hypothetical protein